MSIKLIVSDMDGTLLNDKLEISDRTVCAIQKAQDAGIEFAVATGRTFESGYSIIKSEGLCTPFISLNGALLFNEKQELQFTRDIDRKDLAELIQIVEYYNVQSQFITQKGTYSSSPLEDHIAAYKQIFRSINESLTDHAVTDHVMDHLSQIQIQHIDNYEFLLNNSDIQLLKVFLGSHADKNVLKKIETTLKQNLPDLIITSSSNTNIEVNHVRANKGQAVADLVKMRGYQPDEVITIGDSINDISMLEWATHSYAVDNAHELVKKVARYSAPSHDNDPVAKIIEKVLIGDKFTF